MIVTPIKTKVFRENDNLFDFITTYIKRVPERSIIVVTSKIVALSEGRTAVIENIKTKEKLIISESEFAMPTKYTWMTIKDGMVMAAAGIDESNADGRLILLPKNSFRTANVLRKKLQLKYKVKDVGVLITDSRTMPLRAGITGIALGYAGFSGIKDYKGIPDIFDRKFKFSRVDIADSLAATAVLVMGEGAERQPLAMIEKVDIKFRSKVNRKELHISIEDDMYRPLFSQVNK